MKKNYKYIATIFLGGLIGFQLVRMILNLIIRTRPVSRINRKSRSSINTVFLWE